MRRHHIDLVRFRIDQTDPGHVEPPVAVMNDAVTNLLEQFQLGMGMDDRLIAVGQCGVKLAQTENLGFRPFAFGNVFDGNDQIIRRAVFFRYQTEMHFGNGVVAVFAMKAFFFTEFVAYAFFQRIDACLFFLTGKIGRASCRERV